jgi:hypothetical protein
VRRARARLSVFWYPSSASSSTAPSLFPIELEIFIWTSGRALVRLRWWTWGSFLAAGPNCLDQRSQHPRVSRPSEPIQMMALTNTSSSRARLLTVETRAWLIGVASLRVSSWHDVGCWSRPRLMQAALEWRTLTFVGLSDPAEDPTSSVADSDYPRTPIPKLQCAQWMALEQELVLQEDYHNVQFHLCISLFHDRRSQYGRHMSPLVKPTCTHNSEDIVQS